MKFCPLEFSLPLAIIALATLIGIAIINDHQQDMKHIDQGHCYVRLPGADRGEWQICK